MQKLPQISQIYTDADLRYSPTEFTEHTEPFAIKICVFCEFCGSSSQQESSVYSVKSVGVFLSRKFCGFCEFCGRLSQQSEFCGRLSLWVRGYGKDAIPSYNTSVGRERL